MAFCTKCGAQIPDGAQFCTSCGAPAAPAAGFNQSANPQQPYGAQPGGAYNQYSNPQQPYGAQPGGTYNQYSSPQQPYGAQQPYYGNPGTISFGQRNIAMAIILSIVTCGIYGIYWIIKLVDELNEASGEPNATSGAMVFLLSIVTCGIYLFYWLYKAGERINRAKGMRGLPTDSNAGIIYLVLAIFGFSIVSYALLQSELNKVAAFHGAPAA